jgi:hypothetical protein
MAVNLLCRLAGLREILGGLSAEPFPFQQPNGNNSTTVIQ